MKIFALIPDGFLKIAENKNFNFKAQACLGKNDTGEMTLIITVKNRFGTAINGTQYIADLKEDIGEASERGTDDLPVEQ